MGKIMKICYGCFADMNQEDTVCPVCGYNPESEREKYPLALPHGTVLNGRYILGRVLGQGGFGITYMAKEWKSGQIVAVKEYFPDTMAMRTGKCSVSAYSGQREESFCYGKQCFLDEAKTLAEFIGNRNIVRVHSYFEENGTAYFVMDYVSGISFQKYIMKRGGRIGWQEAVRIMVPVMDALAAVHEKGIIHRDVTPDNIFITDNGNVILLDFGAARYSLGDKSRSLDVVLKHGYAPKEQYARHGRQGPYTDVYSVGACFYFAITGRKPPDSVDRIDEDDLIAPGNLGVNIPIEAENALLKALNVQAMDRYQNMTDFKLALTGMEAEASRPEQGTAFAKTEAAQRKPVGPMKESGRRKWLIPLIAAGALAAIGCIAAIAVFVSGTGKREPELADYGEVVDEAAFFRMDTADDMQEGPGSEEADNNSGSATEDALTGEMQEQPDGQEEKEMVSLLVKKVYYGWDGEIDSWEEYTYDNSGNRLIFETYIGDGTLSQRQKNIYDVNGNRISLFCYRGDGSISWWTEDEYDSDGNAFKTTGYQSDGSVFWWYESTYDEAGNETSWIDYGADGNIFIWQEYEYNDDGKLTKTEKYDSDGTLLGWTEKTYDESGYLVLSVDYDSSGVLQQRDEYLNDSDGNVLSVTGYDTDDTIVLSYEYTYDIHGNMLTLDESDMNGKAILEEYLYEFDEQGNVLKKTTYDKYAESDIPVLVEEYIVIEREGS